MSEEFKSKWWKAMIARYGSEEAVKNAMRQNGIQGRKTGTGGFYVLSKTNPEQHKEISASGGRKRHAKD